ncbi:hypothetical protein C8N43_1840 [Litoreibacter ponti]|uniref:DUF302 domain-containing protein n=1 Tax=Litoreibacter ponti TaxID=1510457 RepID=A0A2T6BM68_9RHOB|nr:hypothetical protein [Litoreibacter ponti]PTX57174.1 hypothetical protein C8N43_1840 [Litoreibacter ponti]
MIKTAAKIVCLGTALAASSLAATERDWTTEVGTVLEVCNMQPIDFQAARGTLLASGWQDDPNAAPSALFNVSLHQDVDPTSVEGVARNALALADAVAENPANGEGQISMHLDELHLGVLGSGDGAHHCVLSGPSSLHQSAKNRPDVRLGIRAIGTPLGMRVSYVYDELSVFLLFPMPLYPSGTDKLDAADLTPGIRARVDAYLDDVAVHMVPRGGI